MQMSQEEILEFQEEFILQLEGMHILMSQEETLEFLEEFIRFQLEMHTQMFLVEI